MESKENQERMIGKTGESADTPKVSVIVPVCNVENYLRACLDSLQAQTLKQIEFILVDDGSKDSCPQILAQAAQEDSRMKVVTKPNGGYGSAINAGLKQARGRYIGIVEPDDFIDAHMYEDLFAAAMLPDGKEADIVKSSYWEYYDIPGKEPYMRRPNLMNCMPKTSFVATAQEQFEVLFHHPSIWSAIYRRKFLQKHQIRMMEAPGGGWVDNPFFFETMLQAKQYVWIPAAYYYYRQTNPNSSSHMKSYQMPYERLRDLRALFKRLHVTDPQIWACLYARHFFYTFSTIGEWGFSEKDPELHRLIKEAMEAVDKKILYGGYRGITGQYQQYYESIVEDPAQHIPEHKEKGKRPKISVIVPMYNDRFELMNTCTDLAKQNLEDIEVFCVDGESKDLSLEIAHAFAKRDVRFQALSAQKEGYADALRVGLEAARAPLMVIILPGTRVPKEYFQNAWELMSHGADLGMLLVKRQRTFYAQDEDGTFETKGIESELVLCAAENIGGCIFRTKMLKNRKVSVREGDDRLLCFLFEAVLASEKVALRFGDTASGGSWGNLFRVQTGYTDQEIYQKNMQALSLVQEAASVKDEEAKKAFRCLVVRRMLDDVRVFISSDQGDEIFKDMQEAYRNRFRLCEFSRASYCNIEAFLALEQALCSSCEDTLRREMITSNSTSNKLRAQRRTLEHSRSYKIAYGVLQSVRKIKRTVFQKKNK